MKIVGSRQSGLILRAGRSGWWIETELQKRFRLDFCFGFGMLAADDGLPKFRVCKRKRDLDPKGAGERELPAEME